MSNSIDYKKILTDLKYKLDRKEMSTLVGAGFSKNIDDSFPNWFELIHEMVVFTEGRRLEKAIKIEYPGIDTKSEDYERILKDEIWSHIEAIGPLKAVSDYIKAKGFREAVDHMVEQHTPVIEPSGDQRYLCSRVDGKVVKKLLSSADVAAHEKLVNLPWNNIFTTNYDNLLEECIDTSKKREIDEQIADLNTKINERRDALNQNQTALELLLAELAEKNAILKVQLEDEQHAEISSANGEERSELLEEIKQLEVQISRLGSQMKYEGVFIKRQESQIDELNDLTREFRTTVKKSAELAIRKNQNIIKIHGSIYTGEPKAYGFDGDPSKNYVIAQEDYDSYSTKHEAFMQLMRISLLQESFCLFGFSGIDPNFLGWIAWVRDVIQKNPATSPGTDKIYMIDVGQKEADPEKALFYKNHQIAFIPLGHPDVLRILKEITGSSVDPVLPKDRINLLLDFLSTDKVPSDYKIAYEVLKQNKYQNLWDNRPFSVDAGEKLRRLTEKADEMLVLKPFNRIPQFFGDTDQEQKDALEQFAVVYQEFKDDPEKVDALLKVTLIMLQEVYLPHSVVFAGLEHIFPLILEASQARQLFYHHFLLIDLKDAVWKNDTVKINSLEELLAPIEDQEIQQELTHQRALSAFYNFDFAKLKSILDSWITLGHWVLKKAGLLSHFSIPDAIDVLELSRLQTAQENAYKYHVLSYLHSANDFSQSGQEEYKVVRAIEKGNIKSFNHPIDRLLERLNKKPGKILPYGEGIFNITNTVIFGPSNKQLISLQLLNVWIESGHPLHLTYVRYLEHHQVYKPLQMSMHWFPEPAVYLALQFTDGKFIARVIQDLVYSDILKDRIPGIAENMMRAFFDSQTPASIQKNIVVALSEIISVLDPEAWKSFFIQVWDQQMQNSFLSQDLRIRKQEFLTKGIPLLTDAATAQLIIDQLLDTFLTEQDKQVKDNVVQLLYLFRTNYFLQDRVKSGALSISIDQFNGLISKLQDDVFFLFGLGNISFLFNDGQEEIVKQTLKQMDALNNNNTQLWRLILFFGNGDPEIEQKVKNEILRSSKLWETGINFSKTELSQGEFIRLSPLRRYRKGKGLAWTVEELRTIYERMVLQLNNIDHWVRNFGHDWEFREIVREMKLFLEAEENHLASIETFPKTRDKALRLYNADRKSEQNVEALFGNDQSDINSEINNISEEIYRKDRLAENMFLIDALVYRVLLRKEPGVAAALSAISNWLFYLPGKDVLRKYQRQIEMILESFKNGTEINMDEPRFQECLIKLAIVLKRWEVNNAFAASVLDLLQHSRFNYIRNNLKSELEADGAF